MTDTAELVEMAASRFRTEAALTSGAVGASAALPAFSSIAFDSTGISTCLPSTTPFGLALGPDLP